MQGEYGSPKFSGKFTVPEIYHYLADSTGVVYTNCASGLDVCKLVQTIKQDRGAVHTAKREAWPELTHKVICRLVHGHRRRCEPKAVSYVVRRNSCL